MKTKNTKMKDIIDRIKLEIDYINKNTKNSLKPVASIGLMILCVILFSIILFRSPETIEVEKIVEKIVEVETKVIEYVDNETNETVTTYWYYSYERDGKSIGYDCIECGYEFDLEKAYTTIRNESGEEGFTRLFGITQISEKSFDWYNNIETK